MIIKVKTTPEQKERIEDQLQRYNHMFYTLREKYDKDVKDLEDRIFEYKKFWKMNEVPVYTTPPNKLYNPNNLWETKTIWKEMGMSITLMKPWGTWVCEKCKQPALKKYIATGHDHTDYSYDVCDCEGVRGNKKWSKLE